jgi:hypothetical protein
VEIYKGQFMYCRLKINDWITTSKINLFLNYIVIETEMLKYFYVGDWIMSLVEADLSAKVLIFCRKFNF